MCEQETWILILTHGDAGKELVKSAEMIVGELKDVYAISLLPEMSSEDLANQVKEKLDEAPKGTLILTDLFGGTPSNVTNALSSQYEIYGVTGLNIAMLIEADFSRKTMSGSELARAICQTGSEACRELGLSQVSNVQ